MDTQEIARLQSYLRRTFRSPELTVRARPRKDDSAEVYIGEEFIGVIFRDEEDDYNFSMAILAADLD